MEEEINFTSGKDIDLIVVFVLLEDLVTGLIDFTLDVKDELLVSFKTEVAKIVDVEELELLPASVFILVLDQILFHCVFDLWENSDNFIESLFGDMADITVVFGLNVGCSSVLVRNQSDLTEVTSWTHDLYKSVLSVLISNSDFALSFRDEEQIGSNLTLSDDALLRIVHLKLHL